MSINNETRCNDEIERSNEQDNINNNNNIDEFFRFFDVKEQQFIKITQWNDTVTIE